MPALTFAHTAITRGAFELAAAIERREFTSVEVVQAHIERLRVTAPRLNATVANRYEAALAQAREIDRSTARFSLQGIRRTRPPLLGVPFTVKESIEVAGMPHTAGVVARRGQRGKLHATVVQRLVDAGAIPIATTNTSELTLWIESENRVYGRTNNPYHPGRAAGGSSGGEGAAIGVGGSPFGVASDIGGSIRIPALFCGVFGHKPSRGLVPSTGSWPIARGDAATMLATGLMARRGADLMPLLRLISGPDGKDPNAVEMELDDPASVTLEGLQVTTLTDRSPVPFSRDLLRARRRTLEVLAAAGAHIREVSLPSSYENVLPFLAMLTATGGEPVGVEGPTHSLLAEAGEPSPTVRELLLGNGRHTLPTRITLAMERAARYLPPDVRDKQLARARELTDAVLDAIGDGVLLHPAFPTLAPPHRRTYGRPWLMMPSALFNLAGVPVTEVPLGLSARGLPVGIQVAAPLGSDHLSIAVALELEAAFGGWRPPLV